MASEPKIKQQLNDFDENCAKQKTAADGHQLTGRKRVIALDQK